MYWIGPRFACFPSPALIASRNSLLASTPLGGKYMHECTRGKTRQRGAGERKESLQRPLINFHPGNPETQQSVKTATTGAPQISKVTIAVQWYLASSRRSRNENLWEIVASSPFLRLSLARTYHAWLARFAHPNGELARRLISLCRVKVLLFI